MSSDCYSPIVLYCEWISYDLLMSLCALMRFLQPQWCESCKYYTWTNVLFELLVMCSSLFFSFLSNQQRCQEWKQHQGFLEFLGVYAKYYAVVAKPSTCFFLEKKSEFELCGKNTLDYSFQCKDFGIPSWIYDHHCFVSHSCLVLHQLAFSFSFSFFSF